VGTGIMQSRRRGARRNKTSQKQSHAFSAQLGALQPADDLWQKPNTRRTPSMRADRALFGYGVCHVCGVPVFLLCVVVVVVVVVAFFPFSRCHVFGLRAQKSVQTSPLHWLAVCVFRSGASEPDSRHGRLQARIHSLRKDLEHLRKQLADENTAHAGVMAKLAAADMAMSRAESLQVHLATPHCATQRGAVGCGG